MTNASTQSTPTATNTIVLFPTAYSAGTYTNTSGSTITISVTASFMFANVLNATGGRCYAFINHSVLNTVAHSYTFLNANAQYESHLLYKQTKHLIFKLIKT